MPATVTPIGLTTNRAPFIEQQRAAGHIYIEQPYELYDEQNQETWRRLYSRIKPRWEKYAHPRFLEGVHNLALDPNNIPKLDDINKFLSPLSGFSAKAVAGYIPAYKFFDCLRTRAFPTTITIRDGGKLDYLPEPDIFHDVAGHVPMHTDRRFADVLVRFGEVARHAATVVADIKDKELQLRHVESIIRGMARFFWFTVEFGLMREKPGSQNLKVYGSGLLSSYGEIEHAITAAEVQRYPMQLEWVINQSFVIDHYQPLLFIVDSFDHLYDLTHQLEDWIKAGKLENLAPCEPAVNETDLKSFLEAAV